jgi:hypothetical protein
LKSKLQAIENEINELESVKARNRALLCDPEVLRETAQIKPLMMELKRIEPRLQELLIQWEELSKQMEAIDA